MTTASTAADYPEDSSCGGGNCSEFWTPPPLVSLRGRLQLPWLNPVTKEKRNKGQGLDLVIPSLDLEWKDPVEVPFHTQECHLFSSGQLRKGPSLTALSAVPPRSEIRHLPAACLSPWGCLEVDCPQREGNSSALITLSSGNSCRSPGTSCGAPLGIQRQDHKQPLSSLASGVRQLSKHL